MSIRDKIIRGAEVVGGVVDGVASQVAPQWALERRGARQILAKFDGATTGRRSSNWHASRTGPNREIAMSLPILRARCRDLAQNNTYGRRACSVYRSNIIGTGAHVSFPGADRFDDMVDAQSINPNLCITGTSNLYSLQSEGESERFCAGEVFFVREWIGEVERRNLGLELPFQLRLVPSEYLDERVDGNLPNGNWAVKGVEVTERGRVVAYHFFKDHPDDYRNHRIESVRYDAADVAHVFERWRAGQVRGVPDLVAAMLKIRDFSQYEDVQLIRQKIAASYTVFKYRPDATFDPPSEEPREEKIKPGLIKTLGPGEDVRFANPPGVDGLPEYAAVTLRSISAAVDLTYEQLAADYSRTNFTSGRMGHLEFSKKRKRLQELYWTPLFLWKYARWCKEAALLRGIDVMSEKAKFTFPAQPMIDPGKEVRANRDAMRSGQKTWREVVEEQGRDYDDFTEEYREGFERAESNGLVLEAFANQTTQAGLFQPEESSE